MIPSTLNFTQKEAGSQCSSRNSQGCQTLHAQTHAFWIVFLMVSQVVALSLGAPQYTIVLCEIYGHRESSWIRWVQSSCHMLIPSRVKPWLNCSPEFWGKPGGPFTSAIRFSPTPISIFFVSLCGTSLFSA